MITTAADELGLGTGQEIQYVYVYITMQCDSGELELGAKLESERGASGYVHMLYACVRCVYYVF